MSSHARGNHTASTVEAPPIATRDNMLAKELGAERAPTIRSGLEQPHLEKKGEPITGQSKNKMRSENRKQ
jgi:hypothetical protein